MRPEIAQRIAANVVREFGHEEHFALSLPSRSDLELLATSLVEDHGCVVVWNQDANKIAVRYKPSQAAARSS
jgi:hypothetical protein